MTIALNRSALNALNAYDRKPAPKASRYAVMNHDGFLGYVSGKDAQEAFKRAVGLYGKRITLEAVRTGRHALAENVKRDLNLIESRKRAPYPTPNFEARRQAEIAKAKAQGLI